MVRARVCGCVCVGGAQLGIPNASDNGAAIKGKEGWPHLGHLPSKPSLIYQSAIRRVSAWDGAQVARDKMLSELGD